MTAINALAPRSTSTLPSTTNAAPISSAKAPAASAAPLSVKDTFEAAPSQAAAPAVKTDALLGPTPDTTRERAALKAAQASKDPVAIKAAWEALAATTFGVSRDKVNVISDLKQSKAGVINVFTGPTKGSESAMTVGAGTEKGPVFVAGKQVPVAVVLYARAFSDSPVTAQKILFHEGLHLAHDTLAAKLDAQFRKPGAAKRGETFGKFVDRQKSLTDDQKAVIKSVAAGSLPDTEAVAHVETFINAFPKYAKHSTMPERFMNEGSELLALEGARPSDSVVATEQAHLLALYKSLGSSDQGAMKAVLGDLTKAQPTNWIFSDPKLKAMAAEELASRKK